MLPPINDIECREPIIIEKKVQEERVRENVVLSIEKKVQEERARENVVLSVKGILEGLAVAAIFTTLGLLIWTVC